MSMKLTIGFFSDFRMNFSIRRNIPNIYLNPDITTIIIIEIDLDTMVEKILIIMVGNSITEGTVTGITSRNTETIMTGELLTT